MSTHNIYFYGELEKISHLIIITKYSSLTILLHLFNFVQYLMLSMLGKFFSRQRTDYFYSFFPKTVFHISNGENSHEMSSPVFWERYDDDDGLVFHTCHKLWTKICEIRQNFKGDLTKFCEIF